MKFQIIIDAPYCKGCELCSNFCPKKILSLSKKINNKGYQVIECIDQDACIGCLNCVKMCPDSVIGVKKYD